MKHMLAHNKPQHTINVLFHYPLLLSEPTVYETSPCLHSIIGKTFALF